MHKWQRSGDGVLATFMHIAVMMIRRGTRKMLGSKQPAFMPSACHIDPYNATVDRRPCKNPDETADALT
jgi:hypothetical protein